VFQHIAANDSCVYGVDKDGIISYTTDTDKFRNWTKLKLDTDTFPTVNSISAGKDFGIGMPQNTGTLIVLPQGEESTMYTIDLEHSADLPDSTNMAFLTTSEDYVALVARVANNNGHLKPKAKVGNKKLKTGNTREAMAGAGEDV
jgi:hypothetical protein